MQQPLRVVSAGTYGSAGHLLATHKVLRNTYLLLAATLMFSALTAALSVAINPPRFTGLVTSLVAMALIWFALPRTANSEKGLYVVFGITGLLGFGLGPMLNHYLRLPNGSELVMTALGGTALIFGALSAYVLTTKKDFSFMGGFLMVGVMVLLFASLGTVVAGMFGVDISMAFVALSAVSVLLFSALILFDTSRIINGGETNYIMATIALYLDVYNIFTSLLNLLGFANSDD
jgi:modulator of FtsH protease